MLDRDVIGQRPADAEAFGLGFEEGSISDKNERISDRGGSLERDFRADPGRLARRDGNGKTLSHQ